MSYLGIEPRTYRLKAEYSTIELVTLSSISLFIIQYNIKNENNLYFLIFKKNKKLIMNLNALSQLISVFLIVSLGPACIAYLAYKKAL